MDHIEEYNLKEQKIYQISYGVDNWDAVRFIKMVKIAGIKHYDFISVKEGFGFGKHLYVPTTKVYEMYEFDSMNEYQQHCRKYEEFQKEQRLRGDF